METTAHFQNFSMAILYYMPYGNDASEVSRKVNDKEIFLGPPPEKDGFKIRLNQKEGRYFYEKI